MVDPRRRLRGLQKEDLPHLVRLSRDPRVTRHLVNFRRPMSREDEKDFIQRARHSPRDRVYVLETPGGAPAVLMGFHGISWVDRCAEFGVLVANPRHWGRGLAATAVRLGLELGHTRLNLHRLEVPVLSRNLVARAMYERLGFTVEGVLRERVFLDGLYEDVVMLSHLSQDPPPRSPRARG